MQFRLPYLYFKVAKVPGLWLGYRVFRQRHSQCILRCCCSLVGSGLPEKSNSRAAIYVKTHRSLFAKDV